MNNVDVSIVNVLKASDPQIFGLYFNETGSIPNPNQATRNKAQALFRMYNRSEPFEKLMQRYRATLATTAARGATSFNVRAFLHEREGVRLDFLHEPRRVDQPLDLGNLPRLLALLNKTHPYELLAPPEKRKVKYGSERRSSRRVQRSNV